MDWIICDTIRPRRLSYEQKCMVCGTEVWVIAEKLPAVARKNLRPICQECACCVGPELINPTKQNRFRLIALARRASDTLRRIFIPGQR